MKSLFLTLSLFFTLALSANSTVEADELPAPAVEEVVTDCESYADGYADATCENSDCGEFGWYQAWHSAYNRCTDEQ